MSKPIRVLCVFSTLDRGGAECMCMNLYRHIDRSQVQFDFVKHTEAAGEFEPEILRLGGRIYSAPRYSPSAHLAYLRWWRKHLKAHPEHRIVHFHYFTMAAIAAPTVRRCGCYTITHAHTSRADSRKKALLLKTVGRRTDACFACSTAAGEWMFPGREFTVLRNAVDADAFTVRSDVRAQVRAEFGLEDRNLVLGVVGRMARAKNPMESLAIFRETHLRNPEARLLWIGDGPRRGEVEARIEHDGLQDAVILAGTRTDVPRMLQAFDAYLQPSVYEGLSVAQIEAQAAGLRCFMSDTITREADVTGRCAYLPLGQPALWAETILSTDLTKIDTKQQIVDAGYDIRTTAGWLQAFYLSKSPADHAPGDRP